MKSTRSTSTDLPIVQFKRQKDWTTWLEKNHQSSAGVWLRIAKKSSGIASVSYVEAIEGGFCYGWIDSQGKRYDEETWLQKFTPRGDRSNVREARNAVPIRRKTPC